MLCFFWRKRRLHGFFPISMWIVEVNILCMAKAAAAQIIATDIKTSLGLLASLNVEVIVLLVVVDSSEAHA